MAIILLPPQTPPPPLLPPVCPQPVAWPPPPLEEEDFDSGVPGGLVFISILFWFPSSPFCPLEGSKNILLQYSLHQFMGANTTIGYTFTM